MERGARSRLSSTALGACAATFFTAGAALLAAGAPLEAQRDRGRDLPAITVTGEGRTQATPEVARIRVGVSTEARSARAASRENAGKMDAVVKLLRNWGIPAEKIQTVQFTIEPAYDYPPAGGRPVLRGFHARNVVEAGTEDLATLGDLLDAVITAGGNVIEGLSFEVKDPGAARATALRAGLADARRKAEGLADAAGRRLGDVQQIVAVDAPRPVPYIAGRVMAMEQADAAPPVSPGELTIVATLEVTYRLE